MSQETTLTLEQAIDRYLDFLQNVLGRNPKTVAAYRRGLSFFAETLRAQEIDPARTPVAVLTTEWLPHLLRDLKTYAVATEHLYTTAVSGFYRYVAGEGWAEVNLARMDSLLKRRRRLGQRLPPLGLAEKVDRIIGEAQAQLATIEDDKRLLALRDVAILVTLADTGLRVSELCALRRKDIDWNRAQAMIIGKGDKQAVVRFSRRALARLRRYLSARQILDGQQAQALGSLPLFARHDRGAGKRVLPLSPRTVEKLVKQYAELALPPEEVEGITPHSFRHDFVTRIVSETGNIHLAQRAARHENISTTERYTHLSDEEVNEAYRKVFDDG
ncbi:MAG: tyrosine-type recombinase/integrase [Chloroflexota bacterium]|nr:tyrosine-type recombinase/integrase [Chloroflexota bacterium]